MGGDQILQAGQGNNSPQLLLLNISDAIADIVTDAPFKKAGVLADDAEAVTPGTQGHLVSGLTDPDVSAVIRIQAVQQAQYCRFAAAVRADNGCNLSFGDMRTDAVDDFPVVVAKGDLIHAQVPGCRKLTLPPVRIFLLLLQDGDDLFAAALCSREHGWELGEELKHQHQVVAVSVERCQRRTGLNAAAPDEHAANQKSNGKQNEDQKGLAKLHKGIGHGVIFVRLVAFLNTAKAGCILLFLAVHGLDETDSAETFCKKSGKSGQFSGHIYSPPLTEAGGEKHNTNGDDKADEQIRRQFCNSRLTRQNNRKESQQRKNELKQLKGQIGVFRV